MTNYEKLYNEVKTITGRFMINITHDIPLTQQEQMFIYENCLKNNLSYEMVLGLIQLESNFKKDLVSATDDYGIMQINKNYAEWYANLAKLEDYNLIDFEDNILMGIAGLKFYKEYYQSIEMPDELIFYYMLNSYNMGIVGYNNYVCDIRTFSREYIRKILKYKINFRRWN